MFVRQHGPHEGVADELRPDPGVVDIEALQARDVVADNIREAGYGAQVGDVFGDGLPAVLPDALLEAVPVVEPHDAVLAAEEFLFVPVCPPVAQRAGLIVLGAAAVEAVRHFMCYHHADAAEVSLAVGLRVEKGRLQDAGRKVDAVVGAPVEGVDSLRRQRPFRAVHRFADAVLKALPLHGRQSQHVVDQHAAVLFSDDLELVYVFRPLVRITDPDGHGVEFPKCLFFGGLAHPVEVRKLFSVFVHDKRNIGFYLFFVLLAEIFSGVEPAVVEGQQPLAELVRASGGAFELRGPFHFAVIFIGEVRVALCQQGRVVHQESADRVILEERQTVLRAEFVEAPDEARVSDVPAVYAVLGADLRLPEHGWHVEM